MTLLTPASVFRKYVTDGVPDSGNHDPDKAEIVQLLDSLFGVSRGGWVVAATKADLLLVTPESETDGGVVLNDPDATNNGQYVRDTAAWVRERGFPDTFAKITLGGTPNAQTGTVNAGVDPSLAVVYFAVVGTENTADMTLSIEGETARSVVNAAGNALSSGEWTGAVQFFINSDGNYQLLNDPGSAAASAASATLSEYWAGLSEEVAIPDGSIARDKLDASLITSIGINFDAVSDLLADTTLDYVSGDIVVTEGDIVTAGGFRYTVAASDATVIASLNATGYHLITAGGVKLFVDRVVDAGFNVRAFGALGDYDDDTTAIQRAIWALKPVGGGTLFFPNGGYYVATTLEPAPDCAGLRIIGEGYRGTLIAWASSTAGDLFSLNSDLDHVIIENIALGNTDNCDRLMVIACVRSRFRGVWFRPTTKVNTALVAATTGVTTYDLTFEDCHFESVSQTQLNAIGLDVPRGHTLNIVNCMFSGLRYSLKLGSASESIDGVSVRGTRFESFSGTAADRPGATDCVSIDVINVRGLSLSGSNFELAADTHATSSGHRAVILRQKAIGGLMSGCFVIGHGVATGALEVNHADARLAAIGNSFSGINGYGIIASAGNTSQVYAPSGANLAVGGTTGVSA